MDNIDEDCNDYTFNPNFWRTKVESRFFDIEDAHFDALWGEDNPARRAKQISLKEIRKVSQSLETGEISLSVFVAFGSGNIAVNHRLGCYYTIAIQDADYCDVQKIAQEMWDVILPEYESFYRGRLAELGW